MRFSGIYAFAYMENYPLPKLPFFDHFPEFIYTRFLVSLLTKAFLACAAAIVGAPLYTFIANCTFSIILTSTNRFLNAE